MQRATDNTKDLSSPAEFSLRAKLAMIKRGLSVAEVARQLGVARNTASLAINSGIYIPTRIRIAELLNIKP